MHNEAETFLFRCKIYQSKPNYTSIFPTCFTCCLANELNRAQTVERKKRSQCQCLMLIKMLIFRCILASSYTCTSEYESVRECVFMCCVYGWLLAHVHSHLHHCDLKNAECWWAQCLKGSEHVKFNWWISHWKHQGHQHRFFILLKELQVYIIKLLHLKFHGWDETDWQILLFLYDLITYVLLTTSYRWIYVPTSSHHSLVLCSGQLLPHLLQEERRKWQ